MSGHCTVLVTDLMVLGVAPVYASYKGMLTMRQHTVCSNAIGTKRYIRFYPTRSARTVHTTLSRKAAINP